MTIETREKLTAIMADMENNHIDRTASIRGLALAVLSKEHILFLGPPGTSKTRMTEDFFSYFEDSEFFYWLMGSFTKPEEIFGPVNIPQLKEGVHTHVTKRRLPEAHFAMLDEIYKGNSAIGNALLHIMQERRFENSTESDNVPLQVMVAASNELPADEEKLRALHDRFTLRYHIGYLSDDVAIDRLFRIGDEIVHTVGGLSLNELEFAQTEVSAISFSEDAYIALKLIWEKFKEDAKELTFVSDRRWVKLTKVMRANAWLEGRTEVVSNDILVGEHMLWDTPDKIPQVSKAVLSCADPTTSMLRDIEESAYTIRDEVRKEKRENKVVDSSKIAENVTMVREMEQRVREMPQSTNVRTVGNVLDAVAKELLGYLK